MTEAQQITPFKISNRTYELVPFLKEGEIYVSGDTMVERAHELNANLGEEDGQFILEHQHEIPKELRGKFYLVFPDWRHPSGPRGGAYLDWRGDRWCQRWDWLGFIWDGSVRLVRRVS